MPPRYPLLLPPPPARQLQPHFVANASGILVPVAAPPPPPPLLSKPAGYRLLAPRPGPEPGAPARQAGGTVRTVYLCPTCRNRFPVPEPDPEINFKVGEEEHADQSDDGQMMDR